MSASRKSQHCKHQSKAKSSTSLATVPSVVLVCFGTQLNSTNTTGFATEGSSAAAMLVAVFGSVAGGGLEWRDL